MIFMQRLTFLLFGFFLITNSSIIAQADTPDHKAAEFASGTGNLLYLAVGAGLPLTRDGKNGTNHALRTVDAVSTSVLLTEGLKALTREKRPDAVSHDSFPSGHAAAAFAVATTESQWHPGEAALWFTGAALIASSRVRLHRHFLQDVIVGALVGYGTARLTLTQPRGVLLAPITRNSYEIQPKVSPPSGLHWHYYPQNTYELEITNYW